MWVFIGLTNAGKPTLISVITSARARVADSPLTTPVPNLCAIKLSNHQSVVVADIPGLIEGAHSEAGLGLDFLRHVQRAALLPHFVDVSDYLDSDTVEDYLKIVHEVELFDSTLLQKGCIVSASKIDMACDGRRLHTLQDSCKNNKIVFLLFCLLQVWGLINS